MGWLELIKDYDCIIKYLAREANIVADALNRKEKLNVLTMFEELRKELKELALELKDSSLEKEKLLEILVQTELLNNNNILEVSGKSNGRFKGTS